MNGLDLVIIALLAFFLIKGLLMGFIREIMTIAALMAAFTLASYLYPSIEPMLKSHIGDDTVRSMAAFVVAFLVVYLAVMLLGMVLDRVFKTPLARPLNMMLGGLVGLAKGLFLAAAVLLLLTPLLGTEAPLLKQSKTRGLIQSYSDGILALLPMSLKKHLTPSKPFLPAPPALAPPAKPSPAPKVSPAPKAAPKKAARPKTAPARKAAPEKNIRR